MEFYYTDNYMHVLYKVIIIIIFIIIIIITILASKDEVDTVEEQYLSEVYTPDFLKGLCDSGESDEVNDEDESEENDNAADDCSTDERKNATSNVTSKRAKTDSAFELPLTCTLYNNTCRC